jgi:hypothetical protein
VTILPLVPFLLANKVNLTVNGTTLTHHLPSQLRTLAGVPAYRQYLCRHHAWDDEVFNTIDWPHFHACTLTLSFLKRLFVIKWINDLLPFQEQQHIYKQSPTSQCPSTCGATEDWHHFLRCLHPARIIIWRECQSTIAKTFETWSIDPSLRRLVLHRLARVSDSAPIPLDNLPDEYAMLHTTQETIGEDSLFFGYFTTDWVSIQNRYLIALYLPHSRNQAARGIKATILQPLEQCHACWLLRNTHLHGTDPSQNTSYKHIHLLAQVTELYESAPFMLASDWDIFEIPIEQCQLQSKSTLQAFYTWAQPVVKVSIGEALEMGEHFRTINQYFRPSTPPAIFDIIL